MNPRLQRKNSTNFEIANGKIHLPLFGSHLAISKHMVVKFTPITNNLIGKLNP